MYGPLRQGLEKSFHWGLWRLCEVLSCVGKTEVLKTKRLEEICNSGTVRN